jgi:hypothetical protein
MKKLIIQSSVASEVMNSLKMGSSKAVKTLSKALRRSARQMRRQGRRGIIPPFIHRQFTTAMQKAVQPILVKSVASGELDPLECGKIESQINASINNPFFQIDKKHLSFIVGKLKSGKSQRQGLAGGLL